MVIVYPASSYFLYEYFTSYTTEKNMAPQYFKIQIKIGTTLNTW